MTLRTELEHAITRHDRAGALASALGAVDAGAISLPELYRLLGEMLVDTGRDWRSGRVEVWQEHYLSGVVRTIVESCASRVEAQAPVDRERTVILAAPAEEHHDLGLRMLTDRFILAGWRAHFLGADVPLAQLTAAVTAFSAEAVALSASTHFHRLTLRSYVSGLHHTHPGLRIWVGGPAFAHEHDDWAEAMVLDPLAAPPAS